MRLRSDWVQELYHKERLKTKLHSEDFYWEDGKMVMTEKYHLKRGKCCGSLCRHCPYENKKITK